MLTYIVRRLVQMIPIVFGATLLIFTVIQAPPGDPFDMMIDPKLDLRKIEELRRRYCVDCPLYQQYFVWLKEAAQGNLGQSIRHKRPVSDMISERLQATMTLGITAELIVFSLGIPIGILAARRKDSMLDHVITIFAFAGVSIPAFFFGLLMLKWLALGQVGKSMSAEILLPIAIAGIVSWIVVIVARFIIGRFYGGTPSRETPVRGTGRLFRGLTRAMYALPLVTAVILLIRIFMVGGVQILPSGSYVTADTSSAGMERAVDVGRHLILPALALGITGIAGLMRYVRSSMLEVLRQDYVRTANAKGLNERVVVYKHALRNALMPVITILGLDLPALVGGAIITEQIFSWPGIGKMTFSAINERDYPVLMGLNLMFAVLTMFGSLLADIGYAVVDPRVRYD